MCFWWMSVKMMRIMTGSRFQSMALDRFVDQVRNSPLRRESRFFLCSAGEQSPPERWWAVHDVKWRTSKYWGVSMWPRVVLLFVTWQQHRGLKQIYQNWIHDETMDSHERSSFCNWQWKVFANMTFSMKWIIWGQEMNKDKHVQPDGAQSLFCSLQRAWESWHVRTDNADSLLLVGDASLIMYRILIYEVALVSCIILKRNT